MGHIVLYFTLSVLLPLSYLAFGVLVAGYYIHHYHPTRNQHSATIMPRLWVTWPMLLMVIVYNKIVRRYNAQ
jgi:hypothetical protein